MRCTLKQTGENYEETNSDDRAWRCRNARHSYRFIRGPENWLPESDEQSRLRRLSHRLLCITDIALIQTAKPPDHRETWRPCIPRYAKLCQLEGGPR